MSKTKMAAKGSKVSATTTVNKIAELEAALRAARKVESDKSDTQAVLKGKVANALHKALLVSAARHHVDAIVLGAFCVDASGTSYGKRGKGGTKSPSATKTRNVIDYAVTLNGKEIRIGSGLVSRLLMWTAINIDGRKGIAKPQEVYGTDSPIRFATKPKMAASLSKCKAVAIDIDGKRIALSELFTA